MARPKADLDHLTVAKEAGPPTGAATAPATPARKMTEYAHTLSLRLSAAQYARLRAYVREHEARTGERITHQALFEAALVEYLDRRDA